ncbi:MAG: hypothetical protein C0514_03280 [Candidatus Puniceispirillum sp.]|nr:hypothetical protein [Candidatus Puniceispirillum sp.]
MLTRFKFVHMESDQKSDIENKYAMKKQFYTISVLWSVLLSLTHLYGTAQDDEDVMPPQAIAASSEPDSMSDWIEIVANNTAPAKLDMSGYYMSDCETRAFAAALATNTSIVKLDLKESLLGDMFAKRLIEALKTNKTLRKLDVRDTFIGGFFLGELLECTKTHPTLKTVLYDCNFHIDLRQLQEEGREIAHRQASHKIANLLVNGTASVETISIQAQHLLTMDDFQSDMHFPLLRSAFYALPMRFCEIENFLTMMRVSPRLVSFTLKAKCPAPNDLPASRKDHRALGYAFFDAVNGSPQLRRACLRIDHPEGSSVFDQEDPLFVDGMTQSLRTLNDLVIQVPNFKVDISKPWHFDGEGGDVPVSALSITHTSDADINGLRFVAEKKLVRRLSLDLDTAYSNRDIGRVSEVFSRFPFEQVSLTASATRERVDMPALTSFLDFLKTRIWNVELHLKLPRALLPHIAQTLLWEDPVPCVKKVTFQDHEDLRKGNFDALISRLNLRESLTLRLLSTLDTVAQTRAQPHIRMH